MYSMSMSYLVCKLLLWLLPAGCPLTTPRLQGRLKRPKALLHTCTHAQQLLLTHISSLSTISRSVQTPQLAGHSLVINSLLVSHCVSAAQPLHDSWWSMHTVEQRPHALEHSRAMKPGLSTHAPCSAQALHSVPLLT